MTVLAIRVFGDPVLRQRAREVERVTPAHGAVVSNMLETMRAAPGVGLAAPQVGMLERLFVWEIEERWGAVINPVLEERSNEVVSAEEGCLSVPGLFYPVVRAASVVISGLDESGSPIVLEADGLLARVCQHEMDHLDGILFMDRLPDDLRRDALATLREHMLGLGPPTEPAPSAREGTL